MELRPGARRALEVQGRQAALQHRREQSRATLEQAVPRTGRAVQEDSRLSHGCVSDPSDLQRPDFVVENTRQNVGFAKLDAAGLALDEAHVPGIPFPMPSTGAEVMWNMKMRYRGVGVEIPGPFPEFLHAKGEWLRQSTDTFFFHALGEKGVRSSRQLAAWRMRLFNYLEPAALAGQSAVQTAVAGEQATTFLPLPRPAPRAANAVVLLRCATDRPG